MVKHDDAGHVEGLEEVFRTQEMSRASGTVGGGPGGAALPASRGDGVVRKMFGRRNRSRRFLSPQISAQRKHGTARPRSGCHTSGAASTGPTSPGSLTGTVGSGAQLLGTPSDGTRGSGNGSVGHVRLIGAATTTGAPFPSPTASSDGSPSGGATSSLPGSGGSNPVAPIAAGVGSTERAVGAPVTGLAGQLESAVPTAAPARGAASKVVGAIEHRDRARQPWDNGKLPFGCTRIAEVATATRGHRDATRSCTLQVHNAVTTARDRRVIGAQRGQEDLISKAHTTVQTNSRSHSSFPVFSSGPPLYG